MKRVVLLAAFVFIVAAVVAVRAQSPPSMSVLRDPGCGCCLNWVAHLEKAGFKVTVAESADMARVKDSRGVPQSARSCHTGVVAGYVIEGHVPAADIQRLLKEKPAVAGLAVPGMPAGSPGMEVPTGRTDPYDVLSWDAQGRTAVFARHR
jgi:hypothetical protein